MFVALLLLNLFGCTLAQDSRCNGVPSTGWSCCNSQTPCEVGGGDCDRDSDCLGSLMCGNNNCRDDFSSDGSNWSSGADCCYDNGNECTGSPSTDWNCCSEAFPCALGGGDCDNDEQCQGSLVCGADNCARDFSSNGHNPNWASGSDCCRETAEYVKSRNEGACCVDSTEQHEGCVIHSSYADATEETCKRACDNDAFCKGYSIRNVNGGMFCRLATTPSQCPHNWETISGGNAALDPSATCESSFSGCYVKQNANIPVTVPTTPLVTTTTEATTMPITTTNSGPAPNVTMCGGSTTEVLTPGTIIKTVYYPNGYENNEDCHITITFSDSPTVLIEFNPHFGIEYHGSCAYDYLEARDGPSTDSPLIGSKVCGTTGAPAPIQSTGNSMTLIFHTDSSVTKVGFEITAIPAGPATTTTTTTTTPRPSLPPPSSANCGVKPPSRIIGGAPAGPYSLPWQVALVKPGDPTPFCGGTLIGDRHVLTAAHCTGVNGGVWDIMVGEHDSSDSSDGTRHTVCRWQNHPDYHRPSTLNNDFAIVTLSQPVTIGTRANYACLPTVDEMGGNFLDDKTVTVSGWGNRCGDASWCPPTDLHEVDLPGLSNSACQQLVPDLLAFPITDSMVCAGRTGDNAVGACHGDSGGPLTYTAGGITTLVGVVSWGNPSCLGTTVFARVTNVLPWIQEQMRQAGECDSATPATTPQPPVTTPPPPATTTASSGEVNICDSQAGQVITVPGTTIISPNHPGDYPNNLDCQVSIQFSERVRIRFEAFNVESHSSCRYDYLEVRDGDSSSSSIIGEKLCAEFFPDAIESTGSSMTLVFHTDSSATRNGFRIIVELATGELTTYTPPSVECGRKPLNTKIVGGGEVTPFSLPWQVALTDLTGHFGCGGTLISPRHVLTAAHCMGGSFYVIVGEHDKTDSSDGTRHTVCRAVSHPNYCDTPNNIYCINNDFAIVTLDEPVQIGPRAVPACLPTASAHGGSFLDDKNVTTSGWGNLQSGGSSPNVLHKVTVPGVSNAVCQQLYEGRFGPNAILPDMMCAGNTVEGGVDACQGDSGGPLTYDDQGSAVVVGVVSWGHGCALTDYPGVYSRVTEVLPWINEQMTECP